VAEQDLDATFLTTARAAEWQPDDSPADIASTAACGAARASRTGGSDGTDVAARLAALAQLPSDQGDDSAGSAEVPAPRSHRSGGWGAADRPAGDDGSGSHRAVDHPPADPVDGSGGYRAADDALIAALGGFTGTLGATNTAGLLSGYTPPSGLPTSGQATALATKADEQLALPAQRSGSGRWAAVPDVDEAAVLEPDAPPMGRREHSPAALVSIGAAAAAVAVIAMLFLWPAPRTTNSAGSRPVPLVPALTSQAEPTEEPTISSAPAPTTTPRPRPAATRTRRAAVPPPVVETTPAPSVTTSPTEPPTTSEPPPSESTTAPTTTEEPDDD
jgi:hypothetical protein